MSQVNLECQELQQHYKASYLMNAKKNSLWYYSQVKD
jgi:hypothetical protein